MKPKIKNYLMMVFGSILLLSIFVQCTFTEILKKTFNDSYKKIVVNWVGEQLKEKYIFPVLAAKMDHLLQKNLKQVNIICLIIWMNSCDR